MNTTYELNNARKDAEMFTGKFHKGSPIVEVFTAMVNGEDVAKCGVAADKSVKYIKELGSRAENGDVCAISELNTLRRFVMEAPLMEEMKMLSIFGSYKNVGFDETIEREVYKHVGEKSRVQAANGDVVFPSIVKETYPVPTFTVSGGYAVDYRRVALGDMSKENEGIAQVRVDIRNRAMAAIIEKIYKAIKDANGVKYSFEGAGLTKTGVDGVLSKIRRFGKPTVIGDYALLSQFTPWAGYDLTSLNANGDNFETMMPAGLGFIVPAGGKSPIATWTRGGLTSLTGTNVKTGMHEVRFDIEVGCDLAKGHEYEIAMIHDTNLDDLAD